MCDKCANIDYPIGDSIWTPCGGATSRYRGTTRTRGFSDEDHDIWVRIQTQIKLIRRLQADNATLKRDTGTTTTKGFDGPPA